jgi:hypothetical protein
MRIITLGNVELKHLTIVPDAQRLDLVIALLADDGSEVDRKTFRYYTQNTLPVMPDAWTDLLTSAMAQAYQDLVAAIRTDLAWVVDDQAIPRAPLGVQAMYGNGIVTVTWLDRSDNEDGFYIQRSDDGGGTWGTPISLTPDTTSYQDSTVVEGSTYQYRVAAYNAAGTSKISNVAEITI